MAAISIHHTQSKKAERMGVILEIVEDGTLVVAKWPKLNKRAFGVSAAEAIQQMEALQAMCNEDDRVRVWYHPIQPRLILAGWDDTLITDEFKTPHELLPMFREIMNDEADPVEADPNELIDEIKAAAKEAVDHGAGDDTAAGGIPSTIGGVPTDGAVAYRQGVMTESCPFDTESDDPEEQERAEKWYTEWDAAADAAAEEEDKKEGSVVSPRYRAKYAEAGHPTTCGDELATFLDNLLKNKAGTNLELLEEICGLNGISLAKYRREGIGWEGRLRMTARNMLAKRVFDTGYCLLPETINEGKFTPSSEWFATRKYKKSAK